MNVTILYLFYNQHKFIDTHLAKWDEIEEAYKDKLYFVIIDDCSTPKLNLCNRLVPNINLDVYRIKDNIPWNNSGANNLGFYVASTEWVLRSDFDHVFTKSSAEQLFSYKDKIFNVKQMYHPYRISPSGKEKGGHCNIFLMAKESYWTAGGYDEDFAGNYAWEDHHFLHEVIKDKISVNHKDIRFSMSILAGAETPELVRDKSINREVFIKKQKGLIEKNDKKLRFKWEKSFSRRR